MTRKTRKRRQPIEPWKPPPDAPPLREVIRQIVVMNHQLGDLDDDIGRKLSAIENTIRKRRPQGHPVDVPFPPWGKLGWSGRRGRWRLVVVDDEACEDLRSMPRECRTEACFVLGKLIDRLGLRPSEKAPTGVPPVLR